MQFQINPWTEGQVLKNSYTDLFNLVMNKESLFSEVTWRNVEGGNQNVMWERGLNVKERKIEDEIKEKSQRIVLNE